MSTQNLPKTFSVGDPVKWKHSDGSTKRGTIKKFTNGNASIEDDTVPIPKVVLVPTGDLEYDPKPAT
jgi:hypothetical protein